MTDSMNNEALALEYVLGTLRGEERDTVAARLATDDALANEVRYWEDKLAPSADQLPRLEPKPETFSRITAQINARQSSPAPEKVTGFWQRLLPWQLATAVAFALLMGVSVLMVNQQPDPSDPIQVASALNADYVAILLDESDEPVLTALAAKEGRKLWLKWEDLQVSEGQSLQLWSQSRVDGEIRPLLVFDNTDMEETVLDKAGWQLIKNASHLIITREQRGGSPLGEPSDQILAKGVCVRLAKPDDSA